MSCGLVQPRCLHHSRRGRTDCHRQSLQKPLPAAEPSGGRTSQPISVGVESTLPKPQTTQSPANARQSIACETVFGLRSIAAAIAKNVHHDRNMQCKLLYHATKQYPLHQVTPQHLHGGTGGTGLSSPATLLLWATNTTARAERHAASGHRQRTRDTGV